MKAFRELCIAQQILGNFFMIIGIGMFLAPAFFRQVTSTTITSVSSVRLSENATITSPAKNFELGIFRRIVYSESTTINQFYIGIWLTKFPEENVWVANRDIPFHKSAGTLKVSNGRLVLADDSNYVMWDFKLDVTNRIESLEVELLDNGNLVIRESKPSDFWWQSFDTPTDTLLRGMNMEPDIFTLTSWFTPGNPSSGVYMFEFKSYGKLAEGAIWEFYSRGKYIMAPSLGTTFNMGEPTEALRQSTNASYYAALRLMYNGTLMLRVWTTKDREVKSPWRFPLDECDVSKICGQNMYCEMSPLKDCKCIEGFEKSIHSQELECVKISEPNCLDDVFQKMSKMKLPAADEWTTVDMVVGLEECEKECFNDCKCIAFAIIDTDMHNGTTACAMWAGPLQDVRTYNNTKEEGHDLYVKLPLAHLKKERKIKRKAMIIGFLVGGSGLLIIFSLISFCWRKIKLMVITAILEDHDINQTQPVLIHEDHRSILMDFEDIATATNQFSESNKLGTGGFGVVYKGTLIDGQEIAVKRLTALSRIAIQDFENEVRLIGVIQHINIVRLLGYVSTVTNKLLVYEYLQNLSLDTYLFDPTRSYILTWEMRFNIIIGIVRGLVYLHQDSRFKIIHLDIKPNNILLGKDMVPKISDFGLAKTLECDVTEGRVASAAGTWGYMPREYTMDHVYSAKSDVFSFGVLLLEIICGTKNREISRVNSGETLQSYIWTNWSQGNGIEMIDPVIKDTSFSSDQVLRCMKIGLLCVQQLVEDRPNMASVALMLASQTETIAQPKNPNQMPSSSLSRGQTTRGESSYTVNQVTRSVIEGR